MVNGDVEEYERVHKIAQITTVFGSIIAILLNVWVIISLMTDLLGISFGEWMKQVIQHGWRLPENWVYKYHTFLYTLQWILLVTVIFDTVVAYRYSVEGEPKVPRTYLKIVSFLGFFCGMWLYLAYHVLAYGIIFVASFITFMWTIFVKEGEEEEEEEEFEPEVWRESASVFDFWRT